MSGGGWDSQVNGRLTKYNQSRIGVAKHASYFIMLTTGDMKFLKKLLVFIYLKFKNVWSDSETTGIAEMFILHANKTVMPEVLLQWYITVIQSADTSLISYKLGHTNLIVCLKAHLNLKT